MQFRFTPFILALVDDEREDAVGAAVILEALVVARSDQSRFVPGLRKARLSMALFFERFIAPRNWLTGCLTVRILLDIRFQQPRHQKCRNHATSCATNG